MLEETFGCIPAEASRAVNPIDPSPSPAAALPCALMVCKAMYPNLNHKKFLHWLLVVVICVKSCLQSSAASKPCAAFEPSTTPKACTVFATVPC